MFDDGVAELTQRACRRVALHADTVCDKRHCRRGGTVGMSHARAEYHLTLVLDLLVAERSVVDVEPFDRPLISVRLLYTRKYLVVSQALTRFKQIYISTYAIRYVLLRVTSITFSCHDAMVIICY